MKKVFRTFLLFVFFFLITTSSLFSKSNVISQLKFKQLSTVNGLPTNEVRRIYQDKDGYIWIATTSGLCLFDAYQVKIYKSNLYTPDFLTNNNIRCLSEDNDHNLWIGTNKGLNILNKQTGQIRKIEDNRFYDNVINSIITTHSGITFIGTDRALFRYDSRQDTSLVLVESEDQKIQKSLHSIQYLYEDSHQQLWIASASGLFRYDLKNDEYYIYSLPYTHHVFEDSKKRIWVGTSGNGLYLLEKPYNVGKTVYHQFTHKEGDKNSLGDNVVYAIAEDLSANTLWIGTRSGLSILDYDSTNTGITNYQPSKNSLSLAFNEVNAIIRDRQGIMWLGMLGGGVSYVSTGKFKFQWDALPDVKNELASNAVRSLMIDKEGQYWMGIGSYGFIIKNPKTGNWKYYKELPDFSGLPDLPTINTMVQSHKDSRIWIGTFTLGIYVYDSQKPSGQRINHISEPWLPNMCVYGIKEDSFGNHWIATRSGLALLTFDNKGYNLTHNLYPGFFYCVEQDNQGNIWAGSGSYGVIRTSFSGGDPENLVYNEYSPQNDKLNCANVQCVYIDSKGQIWLGTDGGGISLYNKEKDKFIAISSMLNIPGDGVFSIQEDPKGNLWLGTNAGIVKLSVQNGIENGTYRLFTTEFGLQGNIFMRGVSCKTKDGELLFGGHNGYNYFYPTDVEDDSVSFPVVITDIKINNNSWNSLSEKERNGISNKSPEYTKIVTLKYNQNNINIEFAALNYIAPMQCLYTYRLKGFDKEWQHRDASERFAYYNNLASGTYQFELKASNEEGSRNVQPILLKVIVLPAPWKTWWAYTIYFLLFIAGIYYFYRVAQNKMILKNSLHLKEIEQQKSEEMNHAKLQFFTNVTHELLTPLTIISATVDELKMQSPQYENLYSIINLNIKRLIRLLQQILEFRKAESGNLKLRVSCGDISVFIKNEADSFIPLVKKKKLHFSVVSDPETIVGYFDPDKLDKILYNLLSNASKYNNEGGFIQVNLSYADDKDFLLLRIRDNGPGFSEKEKADLFKRFYEGDYRKFNTIGTGIGLSLTKDLVQLHGGTISIESELGKGSIFTVLLPINKSYFKAEEIEEKGVSYIQETIPETEDTETNQTKTNKNNVYSILVVEDNNDLLLLMTNLLGHDYHIFTGTNGKEGIEVVENENVDLIVADIMMPEMDGIEFCKYIKNNLEYSHIPVILLTAKNTEEDRAEAYDSGANAFISKPFNLQVLHARIKNLLKAKERVANDFKNQLVFELKDLNYTSIDEEFVQRAIDCVNEHLDDPDFDQPQFIDQMGTSKSTLYKKLKSLTGLNTSAFIRNIRLKAACRIMEEKKTIRISELAYAVGFNDPKYFSSCFKKEFSMLPSEYIERFFPDKTIGDTSN